MPYPNQTETPNKVGTTEDERTDILNDFQEHIFKGHNAWSFPRLSGNTMARLCNDHLGFKERYDAIIREGVMIMEERLIKKMDNDDINMNLKAFEMLTRNRKGFRVEKEVEVHVVPRIEVVGINSRPDADDYTKSIQGGDE